MMKTNNFRRISRAVSWDAAINQENCMENNTFKGSLFGGFRRQDVMDYIEKASRESAELLQSQEERIHA